MIALSELALVAMSSVAPEFCKDCVNWTRRNYCMDCDEFFIAGHCAGCRALSEHAFHRTY